MFGSSHDTVRLVSARVPTMFRAAEIVGTGISTSAVSESGPVPLALIAATDTVYDAPFTNPTNVQDNETTGQSLRVTVGAVDDCAVTR